MSQILAIASVRFKTVVRRARGATRVVNVIVTVLMALAGLAISLLLAAVFGAVIWSGVDRPNVIRGTQLVAFYAFFVIGVVFPVFRGAIGQGIDLKSFRVFPISRRRLFGVTFVSAFAGVEHLLYYPALIAVALATLLASASSFFTVVAVCILILVFNGSWSYAVGLALAEMTRGRRMREIVAILAFLLVLAVSVAPQIVIDREIGLSIEGVPFLSAIVDMARVVSIALPPNLAVDAMDASHVGDAVGVVWRVAALALWDVTGIGLAFWIFARYHLADRVRSVKPGKRAARTRSRSGLSFDNSWLAAIPTETRAVASKELRYLFRSVNGRFVLLVVPILIIVIGAVLPDTIDEPLFGIDPGRVLLFGMLLYSVFFSTNFLNNAYAWETDGIKIYFMSPVALGYVVLGKNLGVWLFNVVVVGLALVCWSVLMGPPDLDALVSGLLLFAIALVVFTTSGNILSVLFPIGRDVSSIMNSPSQTATLLSIVALTVGAGVGGIGLVAAVYFGVEHLLPLFLAVILAGVIAIYSFGLKLTARLLDERKDRVIQALRVKS